VGIDLICASMLGGITMASGSRWVVSSVAAMTPAPTQEPLTQQWRPPGGGGSIVTHGRHRDRRQQITRRGRG
jgi:hypothetical protein